MSSSGSRQPQGSPPLDRFFSNGQQTATDYAAESNRRSQQLQEQLNRLAEQEWLLNIPSANLEQQFFDTINRLSARQSERRIEQLLDKSVKEPLSNEEKQQLRDLLNSRNMAKGDS